MSNVSNRQIAELALKIALGYASAHVKEVGGPNRGDQVEFFQHTTGGGIGDSWCADFVYACLLKSWSQSKGLLKTAAQEDSRRVMLAHSDEFSHETGIPRTGYCPTVAAKAKTAGRFHAKDFSPSPGELVLYDFHDQGEPHHIGFVVSRNADGSLRTVEGNTGPGDGGSQGNGDGVYRRTRPRTHVYGFVSFE